eukprot:50621_1
MTTLKDKGNGKDTLPFLRISGMPLVTRRTDTTLKDKGNGKDTLPFLKDKGGKTLKDKSQDKHENKPKKKPADKGDDTLPLFIKPEDKRILYRDDIYCMVGEVYPVKCADGCICVRLEEPHSGDNGRCTHAPEKYCPTKSEVGKAGVGYYDYQSQDLYGVSHFSYNPAQSHALGYSPQ